MAKRGRKPTTSNYKKLLTQATKELGDKKKSLIQAERNLAKAKQKHEELVSEVARLDMVERSLKALVDGTEPPQNVRYVYTYPQWVWYQQPYVTYTQPGYWCNGQWTTPPQQLQFNCHPADMSSMDQCANMSINTTPNVMTTTASSLLDSGTSTIYTNSLSNVLTSNVSDTVSNTLVTNEANAVWTSLGVDVPLQSPGESIVVDLTTHAEIADAPPIAGDEKTVEVEAAAKA